MIRVIGFSGQMASGKDTYGLLLKNHLGKEVVHYSFATPLREELNTLIEMLRIETSENVIEAMDLLYNEYRYLRSLLEFEEGNAYSRTPNMRKALQYLGTDVRRNRDKNYWVNKVREKIKEFLDEGKIVLFTDIRFKNEADLIYEFNGEVIYLDVGKEEKVKRIQKRDNITPTEESMQHISETELLDYPFKIKIKTEEDNIENNFKKILERLSL